MFTAGAVAFLKGLAAFMRKKARSKQGKEQNRATTAALTLKQKQSEDVRRARVRAGASLLGGVPATTAGGGVNTNVGLDPALVADLEKERTYDFGSALPDQDKGATYDFLAGLFGEAGDTATRAFGAPGLGEGGAYSGAIPSGAPGSLVTPPGGIRRTPFEPAAWTIEDLLALSRTQPTGVGGGT